MCGKWKNIRRWFSKYVLQPIFHPILGEVWLFHSITDHFTRIPDLRLCEVSPTRFEALIQDALKKNVQFISLDELYAILSQGKRVTRPFVSITFDDGYDNIFFNAYPILKKYNIPFCVFVAPKLATGECKISYEEERPTMSYDILRELIKDALFTIGAHSVHHVELNKLSEIELYKELLQSKNELEVQLNKQINYMAYPFGSYSNTVIELAEKLGYKMAFAAWGSAIRLNNYNLMTLPRVIKTEHEDDINQYRNSLI